MDAREAVGWLHRRAGFGLHPDDQAAAVKRGPIAELELLISTIDEPDDPWEGLALDPPDGGRREAIVAWFEHLVGSTRPYHDRRTWMLHGWLVSSLAKVPIPKLMVDQIRLLMADGGGSYPDLLEAITVNPAMLVYLDGRTSTAAAPNENYARELLELFSLGVGHYTEDDVQSAASALTGWVFGRDLDQARLVRSRHDDRPQTVLGHTDVADVGGVIAAIVDQPEHPTFVARRIVREYLGDPDSDELADAVDAVADAYVAGQYSLDAAIQTALRLGLDGASLTMVLAPIPWLVTALRVTGVSLFRLGREAPGRIREMGQLPLIPPDVSGWAYGNEWFTASSLIARTNIAAGVATATSPSEPIRVALDDGDINLAAQHLGLTEPFSSTTSAALRAATDPVDRLTLALVSPENLLS